MPESVGAEQMVALVEQQELDPAGQVGHTPPTTSVAHTVQMQRHSPSPAPQFLARQLVPLVMQKQPVI